MEPAVSKSQTDNRSLSLSRILGSALDKPPCLWISITSRVPSMQHETPSVGSSRWTPLRGVFHKLSSRSFFSYPFCSHSQPTCAIPEAVVAQHATAVTQLMLSFSLVVDIKQKAFTVHVRSPVPAPLQLAYAEPCYYISHRGTHDRF